MSHRNTECQEMIESQKMCGRSRNQTQKLKDLAEILTTSSMLPARNYTLRTSIAFPYFSMLRTKSNEVSYKISFEVPENTIYLKL